MFRKGLLILLISLMVLTAGLSIAAPTRVSAANPSADLDQCGNDPAPSPSTDGCNSAATQWENGNLNEAKSVYYEGDTIPYRMKFDNLDTSISHTVTIEWDTTKSGKHAIDYLTTFNETVANADPCLGVSGCSASTTFPIPDDPQVTGAGVTPIAGDFTLYGGTVTGVSAYSYPVGGGFSGDKSARITITFTTSVVNPVLAWGGHIATRQDWGMGSSAVNIPGSPYHMRLIDLDGSGGNQDRSLSASAVIFPGSITIIKDAQPDGSTSFAFTASPAPLSNFSLVDDGSSTNTQLFGDITNFTTYTIQEQLPSGWDLTSITCTVLSANGGSQSTNVGTATASIDLEEGELVTCTYVDVEQPAHLKLVKAVTNDNGGTAVATDFTLSASGPTPLSGAGGVESDVTAGTYALSETSLAGYTASAWVCVGGSQNGSNITLSGGQSATCTITNDDNAPALHLRKVVVNDNGGTAQATDWTLSAAGPTPLSGSTPVDSGASFDQGTYALSESGPSGYTASNWVCVGGSQSGNSITVGLGESATCTITNDDNAPALHLRKVVVNDNGGTAQATDWTLSAAGPTPLSGSTPVDSGASFDQGTYTLSESGPSGYSASAWVCVGGSQSGSSITVGLGESATCTITNDDITAHLTLVKQVVNDNGGTAVATDFTLSASGPTPLSGAGGADSDVDAGSYTLSESGPTGYSTTGYLCVGGTQNGSTVSLALGQSATCTIINNDVTAHLTLVKQVVNDNGGTAVATDFTLSAAGPTPLSGAGGADGDVNAGSYALSETSLAGYYSGAWVCVGGSQSGSNVTLALNESATCTIINYDITAHLTLVKQVVNDNGGTALTTDFTLSASGPTPISGAGGVASDVNAGSYSLSETNVAGYSAGSWVCVGGTQNGSSVTLTLAQSATCTIINDDIAPILHLRKLVVNDNGGTKTVADFTLTADGAGSNDLSGTSPVDSGAGLKADTFALSESSVYGYSASAWVCVGGSQSGSSITLGLNEEATCTITNNDQPGTLIVIKYATPATGSFDFTTTGSGYNAFTLNGDPANNGNVNVQYLDAGSYSMTESTQLGWILTGIGGSLDPNTPYNCQVTGSGGSSGVGDLNTQTVSVSLMNGDTVTCIFENSGSGATRTQGFWATHTPLANIAWFGGSAFGHTFPGVASVTGIGDTLICGRPIDDLAKLMGGFWSDIAKKSDNSKRTQLDQARMQLLQQLLAAELNASAFGSLPSGGSGMFAQWESALCGTNTQAIKTAMQQAASFNTQGDSAIFTPGTSADAKYARSIANIPFWDIVKP